MSFTVRIVTDESIHEHHKVVLINDPPNTHGIEITDEISALFIYPAKMVRHIDVF